LRRGRLNNHELRWLAAFLARFPPKAAGTRWPGSKAAGVSCDAGSRRTAVLVVSRVPLHKLRPTDAPEEPDRPIRC
jgi:hypothetical protein